MAHLWLEDSGPRNGEAVWLARPLDGESAVPLHSPGGGAGAAAHAAALLLCSRSAAGESWLLMSTAPAGVALNGVPLRAGMRVLADHDEVRVAGFGRAFFSTERLAQIEPFPGTDRPTDCPRCAQEIVDSLAVRCPACGRWFHQSAALPCWTAAEHCLCPQPTALDAGYQWTPHGL